MKASFPATANFRTCADYISVCAGQIASAQSASSPVWQDFLNYGTVAQELQATRSQAQPQPLHDMPTAGGQTVTQNERGEAAGPTADCEAAPAGTFVHFAPVSTPSY